jgi:hypothetical protein
VFQSADIQLAAADPAAVEAGDYLAVIGDVHPGACPLLQGVFAHRHPDLAGFQSMVATQAGDHAPILLPPLGPGLGVDARGAALTPASWIHVAAMPDTRAPGGVRTWLPTELLVDGTDAVDRSGELRIPLIELFGLASMIAGIRCFELLPDEQHSPRVTVGKVVIRREGWSVPAGEVPNQAQEIPVFARALGMPRRVFTKSPLERKPMFLDLDSPVLARILCRHARQAAASSPRSRIRFTEMLPGADSCWLHDPNGNSYVSELRLVAADMRLVRSRRA